MNDEILKLAKECGFDRWYGTDDVEFLQVIEAFYRAAYNKAIEDAAKVCDELGEHWSAYKDTALLNGDVELSNAASGEPRAATILAKSIRLLEMK